MKRLDADRIAALAVRLDLTPRQVLAMAARVAGSDRPFDPARLDSEVANLRRAARAGEDAADLALLGYASYALDDIDHALALVWPDSRNRGA